MDAVFPLMVFALTLSGFGLLGSGMERHARQVFRVIPDAERRKLLQTGGWVLLLVALWPAIAAYGLSIGVSVWVGMLGMTAPLVLLLLSYRPEALRVVPIGAFAMSLVVLLL